MLSITNTKGGGFIFQGGGEEGDTSSYYMHMHLKYALSSH